MWSMASPNASAHFFFNDTATTEIYTLSLHDALPICLAGKIKGIEYEKPFFSFTPAVRTNYPRDRKSTRLNSSHVEISYAVFCLKKKTQIDCSNPLGPDELTNRLTPCALLCSPYTLQH